MEIENINMPVLIVRNIVIFPYMIIPLNIGREFSAKAVEEALKINSEIAIFVQNKFDVESVEAEDIKKVGVMANILKMVKIPDGSMRILVESTSRVLLEKFVIENGVSRGEVKIVNEIVKNDSETEALYKLAKSKFEKCLTKGLNVTPEIISPSIDIENPARLADIIVAQLDIDINEKYTILETFDVNKRLELVNKYLNKEIEILDIKNRIQEKMKKGMDDSQKEFFLREQLKAIQDELGMQQEGTEEIEKYREIAKEARFTDEVREIIYKETEKLTKMSFDSAEAGVIRSYLDFIIELPWKSYSSSRIDVKKAEQLLNETHYGLEEVKTRILEYLSVKKISKELKSPILCFVGPPGVGKTSIGKAIAKAMNREFFRMSLGGVRDEAEIRGHRRTYVGALPGRVLRGIQSAKKSNPVFMLDEIDKLGADFRGDPASAMLEVLDPEQNFNFVDHYLEVGYDLSKVFFITTANSLENIPRPLMDRMEIISIPGYTLNEKKIIAKEYLIKRQLKQNGLNKYNISIEDEALEKIILNYTRESGIRNLEREIGKVFRKIAKKIVMGESYSKNINPEMIEELLGIPKYEMSETDEKHDVGVATGLAWTEFGGDVLNIEVVMVKGSGKLILTGQLGDVMQESAQTAFTFIRTKYEEYNGDKEYYKNYDIHIHVPEGAVPKDGPSAGITLATALASKLTGKAVMKNLAMTGEITLTGRVLPIGGLKEKLLAAKLRGMKKVIIPEKNRKDLKEIHNEIKDGLDIKFVTHMEEVLNEVFNYC
jgi:ATP-dependent Lon protease